MNRIELNPFLSESYNKEILVLLNLGNKQIERNVHSEKEPFYVFLNKSSSFLESEHLILHLRLPWIN